MSARHTSIYEDPHNLTPVMNGFARSGIYCSNYFAQGCPTSCSMPSIFTSSLPLDYGGYDDGVLYRPVSVVELLKQKGYQTVGFTTCPVVDKADGYDRGFDKLFSLYDIEQIWKQICFAIQYYEKVIDKRTQRVKLYEKIRLLLIKQYTAIIDYCHEKLVEKNDGFFRKTGIYNHDFEKIEILMSSHLQRVKQSPEDYIDNHLVDIKEKMGVEKFLGIPRWSIFNSLPYNVVAKKYVIGNTFFKFKLWEKFIPAKVITDYSISYLKQHHGKPFMQLLHFTDLHDLHFADHSLQVNLSRRIYNSNKGVYRNYDRYLHDLSINYVDRCIGRIKESLNELGMLDQTHVIITSDHGGIPGYPNSPFALPKLPCAAFKDDYRHVPLIIWNKQQSPKLVEDLHSSLDLAPTICDLMKIKGSEYFRGASIIENINAPEYIIAEHTHRGPADLNNKPIYLCIQSKQYKYIWKEYIYSEDEHSIDQEEFFDLENDPDETTNAISCSDYKQEILKMRRMAVNRAQEIRNNSNMNSAKSANSLYPV